MDQPLIAQWKNGVDAIIVFSQYPVLQDGMLTAIEVYVSATGEFSLLVRMDSRFSFNLYLGSIFTSK